MKYLIGNLLSVGLIRLIGVTAAFIVNILLARLLSPQELGEFYIVSSIALFLSLLTRGGMKQVALKAVTETREKYGIRSARSIIDKIFVIILTGNIIVGGVVLFGSYLFDISTTEFSSYIWYLILWTLAYSMLIPLSDIYRGLGLTKVGALFDNVIANILMVLAFIYIFLSKGHTDIVLILTVSIVIYYLCITLGIGWLSVKQQSNLETKDNGVRGLLKTSMPIIAVNLLTYLLANAGIWIVGALSGSDDAGVYVVAIKIYNLLALPLLVTNIVIESSIVSMSINGERKSLGLLLQTSAFITTVISALLFAIIAIFGSGIIINVFGIEYEMAYGYLLILAVANMVNVGTGSCANYLLLTGKELAVMKVNLFISLVWLPSAIFMTEKYGAYGMAIVSATVVACQQIIFWYLSYKEGLRTDALVDIKMFMVNLKYNGKFIA